MPSLKVFISSSVYVTIDPGTSSVVVSPSCLIGLLLAIFCVVFTGFFRFLVVASERGFFMPLQELVVHVHEEERCHLSLQKFNEIHLRAVIDRFLRSPH